MTRYKETLYHTEECPQGFNLEPADYEYAKTFPAWICSELLQVEETRTSGLLRNEMPRVFWQQIQPQSEEKTYE